VFPQGRGCRVVWITDLLPDTLVDSSSMMMEQGSLAMIQTLQRQRNGTE
jgi:hypothetical protein